MALHYSKEKQAFRIQITRIVNGERIQKSKLLPKYVTEEEAKAIHDRMESNILMRGLLVAEDGDWVEYASGLLNDKSSWIYTTLNGIRKRSKDSGRACELTPAQVYSMMLRSKGRCEVTGLRFDITPGEGGRRRPFFHSIDREDSSKGYTPSNCRLICVAVNVGMQDWGESVFERLALGYVMNKYVATGFTSHLITSDLGARNLATKNVKSKSINQLS